MLITSFHWNIDMTLTEINSEFSLTSIFGKVWYLLVDHAEFVSKIEMELLDIHCVNISTNDQDFLVELNLLVILVQFILE